MASAGVLAVPAVRKWSLSHCDDRTGEVFPAYDSEGGFGHDVQAGFSLFLQERCQRIFFIRHAEGVHNEAESESTMEPKNAILMKENSGFVYWDPKLTKKGENQCLNLKSSIRGSSVWGFNKPLNLDLVVVSPTTRTLQTAFLSLGTPDTPGAPPFIANELCREHISEAMCDGRSTITSLKRKFQGVDFSLVADDEDTMFLKKETEEDVEERGREFLKWLCGRQETHIAVVTHSIFLKTLLKQFATNVSEQDRSEIHQSWVNAEMRSIMLCAHKKFTKSSMSPEEEEALKQKKVGRSVWNLSGGDFDLKKTKSSW